MSTWRVLGVIGVGFTLGLLIYALLTGEAMKALEKSYCLGVSQALRDDAFFAMKHDDHERAKVLFSAIAASESLRKLDCNPYADNWGFFSPLKYILLGSMFGDARERSPHEIAMSHALAVWSAGTLPNPNEQIARWHLEQIQKTLGVSYPEAVSYANSVTPAIISTFEATALSIYPQRITEAIE